MLSGVKPTGSPHIGNYFGAMRQFVQLQDKFEKVFVFIADYHALNFIKDAELMRENIFNLAVDYLALGLDPKRVIFYQQSKIPAHTELAWIFNTLTSLGYLKRAHVYKDAKEKGKENELSIGDFNYPILMASDILLYDADVVPVGKDQKQHLEMTRDIAEKFNSTFKVEIFKLPEPYILSDTEVVPGTDGRKMSKSYGNTIPLFAEKDEIAKTVMKIVTDSEGEIPVNVYDLGLIYRLDIDDDNNVEIDMTLTAPNCPIADQVFAAVYDRISRVPGVRSVKVNPVYDPPWDPSMMSEEAKKRLGY